MGNIQDMAGQAIGVEDENIRAVGEGGISVGDLVCISADLDEVKRLQEGHGEWREQMTSYLGKIAYVLMVSSTGDLRLQVGTFSITLNPKSVRRIRMEEFQALKEEHQGETNFNHGDIVQILSDEQRVKDLQQAHGGWVDQMQKQLGKIGYVEGVVACNGVTVRFYNATWILNQKALIKVVSCQTLREPVGGQMIDLSGLSQAAHGGIRREANAVETGNLVYISSDIDEVKRLQRGHGEWTDAMSTCLGKIAYVQMIFPTSDLRLQVGTMTWTVNPKATRKISAVEFKSLKEKHKADSNFSPGDVVQVLSNERQVKELQRGHGGWVDGMRENLDKIGHVIGLLPNGILHVHFTNVVLCLNCKAVVKVVPCQATSGEVAGGQMDGLPGLSPALSTAFGRRILEANGIKVEELLCISSDIDEVKRLQRGHGEWIDAMSTCLGKIAYVQIIFPTGDLRLQVGTMTWTVNPKATRKISGVEFEAWKEKHKGDTNFAAGDIVQVLANERQVKELQLGHVEWVDGMKEKLGKIGFVLALLPAGIIHVGFSNVAFAMNHKAFVKVVPCQATGASPGSVDFQGLVNSLNSAIGGHRDEKLFQAVIHNDVANVRERLEKGTDVNQNYDGHTAIQIAVRVGHIDVLRVLIEHKASLTIQDNEGCFVIHDAVGKDQPEATRILLQAGANPNVHNNHGKTPFHFAALGGLVEIGAVLLERGANVNFQDNDGNTPMHEAILGHHEGFVQMLIDNEADLNLKNSRGANAFHLAAFHGEINCLRCILDHYKKKDQLFRVNEKKGDGFTALHLAAHSSHLECARILLEHGEKNALNNRHETPVYVAAGKLQKRMVSYLVRAGCDPNIPDKEGNTPLHMAAREVHADMVSCLLKVGSDPNIPNREGNTPLHEAFWQLSHSMEQHKMLLNALLGNQVGSAKCTRKIVVYLAEKGADPGLTNKEGQSAIDLCQDTVLKQKVLDAAREYKNSAKNGEHTPHSVPSIERGKIEKPEEEQWKERQCETRNIEDMIAKLERLQAQVGPRLCPICMEVDKNVVFSCGHGCCKDCSVKITTCPICRVDIVHRIFTYD